MALKNTYTSIPVDRSIEKIRKLLLDRGRRGEMINSYHRGGKQTLQNIELAKWLIDAVEVYKETAEMNTGDRTIYIDGNPEVIKGESLGKQYWVKIKRSDGKVLGYLCANKKRQDYEFNRITDMWKRNPFTKKASEA